MAYLRYKNGRLVKNKLKRHRHEGKIETTQEDIDRARRQKLMQEAMGVIVSRHQRRAQRRKVTVLEARLKLGPKNTRPPRHVPKIRTARQRFFEAEFHSEDEDGRRISFEVITDWRYPKRKIVFDKVIPYPRSIGYIISNEFCERFNFYGMRTILVLYLTNKLKYTEEESTIIFHVFTMLVYMFPLIGAIIADSWLGKYKTILYLSILYALGCILMAMGALPHFRYSNVQATIVGLLLIAVGTGGIKPCVSAFGGDQFILPHQAREIAAFFSLFYFSINAGSMLSTTITPILRADVHCFGEKDCFSLAFGVPAFLMVVSVLIFIAGKSLYRRKAPEGNMIFGVSRCLTEAVKGWYNNRKLEPRGRFLDYAIGNVDHKVLNDTRVLIKILILYLPFPVFWALFDQQGSRWTFQATRMNGRINRWVKIKPDQMQVVNPLLILIFIPVFETIIYPIIAKFGIRRPLQKLTLGGLLAAGAFLLSAHLEMQIAENEPLILAADTTHLRFYNGMPCDYQFTTISKPEHRGERRAVLQSGEIEALKMWSDLTLKTSKPRKVEFSALATSGECANITGNIEMRPGEAISYFMADDQLFMFNDESSKPTNGNSMLRTLINSPVDEGPIILHNIEEDSTTELDKRNISTLTAIDDGPKFIDINGINAANFSTLNGGVYAVIVQGTEEDGYKSNIIEVVQSNKLLIFWQLPQIVVMTAAEVMFSVTGLEFTFTQAPTSMKAVLQACWLLTVSVGNMLVVVISQFQINETQAGEFIFFAMLMVVDMLIFMCLASRYRYMYVNDAAARETGGEDDDKFNNEGADSGDSVNSPKTNTTSSSTTIFQLSDIDLENGQAPKSSSNESSDDNRPRERYCATNKGFESSE